MRLIKVFALFAVLASPLAAAERPNILFMLADDWAWPHASCLGDPVVKTPTFDRVVREGVMFRNAHSAAPSCSPSRAAMLTGQMPWRLEDGANLNGSLAAKFVVYPDLLEKAGYFVGLDGKGYGPGSIADRPRNPAGPEFKSFEAFLAQRPKGQPFCFWLGSHNPHRPYVPGSGIKAGLDPNKVVVPPYLPDNDTVRSDICDYYQKVQVYDQEQSAEALAALEKTGELDNTIVVMSGDNGWPFPRGKATNYDSGTHQNLAIRWGAQVKPGRVVEDFVSLADLAPTFLEAAGVEVPACMNARSLMPLLTATGSGQIDPTRDHIITGMETHTPCRDLSDGNKGGFPRRAIDTGNFSYIRNFHPERYPAGEPKGFEVPGAQPRTLDELRKNTPAAFGDIDAGPTKAWLVQHRDEPAVVPIARVAFSQHPAQELYDLRKDPYELNNLAGNPEYAAQLKALDAQLMKELAAAGDPRATGEDPERFENYPKPEKTGKAAKGKNKN